MVNHSRFQGFVQAYADSGESYDPELVFMNLDSRGLVERAVDEALEKGASCLVCMDDAICSQVLRKLRQEHKKVPADVRVASFYNSSVLENSVPAVTSLAFDGRELGSEACRNLLEQIEGKEVKNKTLLSYEVVLKESTQ
jgi:DNA-binding LacI/PurR family transcriptional regulator